MIVHALMTGRSKRLPNGKRSAIGKHPVTGPVAIGHLGLAGDLQVNKRYHGGPEMAVHLYPLAHHAWWRGVIGDHPLLNDAGAFGGNLAMEALDETQVRIGERFQLGTALIEVSQPRMPCATIEQRFERTGMVAAILASGRCGWHFRVIEEGAAQAGDSLIRVAGSGTPVTVRDAFLAIANPAATPDRDTLDALAANGALAQEWRDRAAGKLARLMRDAPSLRPEPGHASPP